MFNVLCSAFIRYYVRQTKGYECFRLTSFYYSQRWKARYMINIRVFMLVLSEIFSFAIGKRWILEANESYYYMCRRGELFSAAAVRLIWRLRRRRRCDVTEIAEGDRSILEFILYFNVRAITLRTKIFFSVNNLE